jgi:hypothetical protein
MSKINGRANGASQTFWEQVSKLATDKGSSLIPHHAVHTLKALASVGLATPELVKVDLFA